MNHSKNAEGGAFAEHLDPAKRQPPTPWLILALPLVFIGLVLCFSPNFKSVDGMRTSPLGGDFLQEWVGAKLFERGEENKLYDLEYVQAFQHDSSMVGFDWPEDEYFPMVYPPFYYASLRPLSRFRYPVSSIIWAVLSGLAFSISGFLLFRYYPPCQPVFGRCFVGSLVFVPLLNCFNMGQKSTYLLLILSATFVLLHRNRPFLAGTVFGLIVFKPHLGVLIGLTMLLKRQWKFALGALAVVVVVFCCSWLNHPRLIRDYAGVVSGMGEYVQTGGYQLADSNSLWGAAQLTFGWLTASSVKMIAAGLSLLIVGLLWRVMQGRIETGSPRFSRQFAAMSVAMVLLSPHFYGYDLTVLLLPMLLVISTFAPGAWRANLVDRSLGIVWLGIFVLAGMFSQIATVIQIQPSIFLMTAALVLLGWDRSGDEQCPDSVAD